MNNKEQVQNASVGAITWGFLWRDFAWSVFIGLIVSLFIAASLLPKLPTSFTADEVNEYFNSLKLYSYVLLITGILTSFICSKLATNGIKQKFNIHGNKLKDVISCITLILIIFAVYSIADSFNQFSNISNSLEQYNNNPIYIKIHGENLFTKLIDFCKTFSKISLVINIVLHTSIIFMVRKWLKED